MLADLSRSLPAPSVSFAHDAAVWFLKSGPALVPASDRPRNIFNRLSVQSHRMTGTPRILFSREIALVRAVGAGRRWRLSTRCFDPDVIRDEDAMTRFLTIRGKLVLLSVAFPLAISMVVAGWWYAFDRLKVNGPVYGDLILMKDLVADILPPPKYIIESYLVTAQALIGNADAVATHKAKIEKLKGEYDDRHRFWKTVPLAPELEALLMEASYAPVVRFYDVALNQFFPALTRGDRLAAEAAFGILTTAYEQHRAAVDLLVVGAEKRGRNTEAAAASDESSYKALVMALTGMVSALALAGGMLISRSITVPLRRVVRQLNTLAAGDVDVTVEDSARQDEIGTVAQAVEVWRLNAIKRKAAQFQIDLENAARGERVQRMELLTETFDVSASATVDEVVAAAARMENSAQSVASVAEQTARQAHAVAAAAQEAATSVQTVAQAAGALSTSISEIGRQAGDSTAIARTAATEAARTDHLVQGLANAADKIGAVVNLISSIASQTNLLALNATIEAARAGDAGRGFGVVAGEVKNLANQTARATDEISSQIAEVQSATQQAVSALRSIAGVIEQMNAISETIAAAVEQQASATRQIATHVQHAAQGTDAVQTHIGGVLEGAREADRASHEVFAATQDLRSRSGRLQGAINDYLGGIQAVSQAARMAHKPEIEAC